MTAIEWLEKRFYFTKGQLIDIDFEQAKEMEKEQIIDAYHINPLESKWKNIGIDYYNETFKTK